RTTRCAGSDWGWRDLRNPSCPHRYRATRTVESPGARPADADSEKRATRPRQRSGDAGSPQTDSRTTKQVSYPASSAGTGRSDSIARMPKPPRPWIVTPHDIINKLDDNLWTVESPVPGVPIRRRMCIIKRSDGQLVFHNAVPLDDAALAEVTAWGKPAFLVIPHNQHGIDAHAFMHKLG